MADIVWDTIDITGKRKRTGEPTASIGFNRIALNSDACALIDNIFSYKWVEVRKGRIGSKLVAIGLHFVSEKSASAVIPTTHRMYKEKFVDALDINSKALIKELFGENGIGNTSRYPVSKQSDTELKIDVLKTI